MNECLFCKINNGEIPATLVYEDETVIAFEDINPKAPTHILIIPRKHIASLNDLSSDDTQLIGHMVQIGKKLANQYHHDEEGYRLVINCNEHGGQEIYHIHLHLLAGRQLKWPPG